MPYLPRPSVNPPSFPSRQNKVIIQRQYREKEGVCFNTLRDVIKELTGEELLTRQEILRKAIGLLSDASETKRKNTADVVSPVLYGMRPFTNPADTTLTQAHSGHSAQPSPSCPKTWPTNAEFDAEIAYYAAQFSGQPHDFIPDMDSTLFYAGYQKYNEGWPNYPQG